MIPTKRDEKGHIIFQIENDIEVVFDPDDTWVEIRDLDEYEPQAAVIGIEQIDRMIDCFQRIKRMVSE